MAFIVRQLDVQTVMRNSQCSKNVAIVQPAVVQMEIVESTLNLPFLQQYPLQHLNIQKGWVMHWVVTVHTLPVKAPQAPYSLQKANFHLPTNFSEAVSCPETVTYSRHLKDVPFCILVCVTCRQAGVSCLTKVLSFSFLLALK